MPEGVFLATKRQIKKSGTLDFAGSEPDFMVFKRRKKIQACHIVELKDGHVFDTKKAGAERTAMHRFIERNARQRGVLSPVRINEDCQRHQAEAAA